MTYDNVKTHKKPVLHLSLEDTLLEKPQGEVKLTPPQLFKC